MTRWLAVVVALALAPAANASTPKFHATYTPDARLAALVGGRIAWKCESFPTRFLLQDFASGAVTTVDDRELGESEAATPIGLGQPWLDARRGGYHWTALSYYDLLTGAWREELTSPRVYANLDSPGLAETMCRPLWRIHAPGGRLRGGSDVRAPLL